MDVGVVGVVVIDRDPLEPGPEVMLHLAHEASGMEAEIELRPLLGRDDGFPEARVAGPLPGAEASGAGAAGPADRSSALEVQRRAHDEQPAGRKRAAEYEGRG